MKAFIYYAMLIFIVVGCNSTVTSNKPIKPDSHIFHSDSLYINNNVYIRFYNNDRFYCLLSENGDTVIDAQDYYHRLEIIDINNDSFSDLQVFEISNTPNQCLNYLYDEKIKTFRILENCSLDISPIEKSGYYYTYNSTGCSDLNWQSTLCKIDEYNAVKYGSLIGFGCKDDTLKMERVIQVLKNDEYDCMLIDELSYDSLIIDNDDKWDFIKTYWKENLDTFDDKN